MMLGSLPHGSLPQAMHQIAPRAPQMGGLRWPDGGGAVVQGGGGFRLAGHPGPPMDLGHMGVRPGPPAFTMDMHTT